MELLLYDSCDDAAPARTIGLERAEGPLWSVFVPGVRAGQAYAFRVHGPFDAAAGHRCNPAKILLDPYALAIGRMPAWQPGLAAGEADPLNGGVNAADLRDTSATGPLGLVVDEEFDWQGVSAPRIAAEDRVIYETHVRGTTMLHPGVPAELRGTYLGLCHPVMLDHYARLGITTIQLLPVHAIVQDERLHRLGLRNYWGYNTLSYFAPEPGYAAAGCTVAAVSEFRTMVRELHRAGLEVFLDVVYNHSGEGNEHGPTLSLRGFDNAAYYLLADDGGYRDVTGTGNTLDLNGPAALQLTLDSLRWWAGGMGIDGFRFDLAAAMGRQGNDWSAAAPVLQAIAQDPLLQDRMLIAEPWDLGEDGYRLGSFPWQFGEWNDRFRDAVRSLWNGQGVSLGELATRISGSSDVFRSSGRLPAQSVNFVTAHDGFTLRDLVSYSRKHNDANMENGRDGSDFERSRNLGVEGETDDPAVNGARLNLRRAMLALLLFSRGTPMLLGGDELGRTQHGNNNAYCQDNVLSWFDWAGAEDLSSCIAELTALRRRFPQLRRNTWLNGGSRGDVQWLNGKGEELHGEQWAHGEAGILTCLLRGEPGGEDVLLVIHGSGPELLNAPPGFSPLWSSAGPAGLTAAEGGRFRLAACAVSLLVRPAASEDVAA